MALVIAEQRPSRRAPQQACRTLKLTKVHLPVIAQVIAALDTAEALLQSRARRFAVLPEQIARAEAGLYRERPARGPAAGWSIAYAPGTNLERLDVALLGTARDWIASTASRLAVGAWAIDTAAALGPARPSDKAATSMHI